VSTFGSAQKIEPHPAFAAWGDSLKGRRWRGDKIVAGWEWDGSSPGLMLLLAPKGTVYADVPESVWLAAQR
jgi:hypothetical protein